MAVFKCKMCGGTIEFNEGDTVGVCDSCGTRQTLPRLNDEKIANLYDRANHFRRANDFDKAAGIYEQILNENASDAEAYWSLVLCRYGIEYVEDPSSRKRVPTINRAQFTSIYSDEDYKSAINYADGAQKAVYEEEAAAIDEIQKGILAISQKESPFDVFICYKETDANGRRTQDSVLATDLYHQLTQEGFKVFFSRITLEDKLGTAYEPYIFAALNSAKVMVVLGTKPEYFNAVWVKNEWSRYLALIKNGAKKMLIPAYRDMDPYDLPEEFSHLQAQDMSKLGFMQDLIRGIKKIISAEASVKEKATPTVVSGGLNVAPLLKRAFMFLEDGNFKEADEYCEKVLDLDPENAEAYLGKLMAETKTSKQEKLADCAKPFDNSDNYKKVMRFGSDKLKSALAGYIEHICDRNENERITGIYNKAKSIMNSASTEDSYKSAAGLFKSIGEYNDSAVLAEECLANAEVARKDEIFAQGIAEMKKDSYSYQEAIDSYQKAINIFKGISGWENADEKVNECLQKIEKIKEKQEAERLQAEEERIRDEQNAKKRKKAIGIVALAVCVCTAFIVLLTNVIIPNGKYNAALKLYNDGKYDEAIDAFNEINGYKDSDVWIEKSYIGKYGEEKYKIIKNTKIGQSYIFGSYEQDNNTTNGKEQIEWIVIDKKGDEVLLISKYALDCKKYNNSYTSVTWESCSLRSWLNNEFYNSAFSSADRSKIKTTLVTADKNPSYSTNPGNYTNDKVFLLSITEAEKYFKTDEERVCAPTAYAKANGAYTSSSYTVNGKATCWWWLRSPGGSQGHAASVLNDGGVYYTGYNVNSDNDCVRPALWITL